MGAFSKKARDAEAEDPRRKQHAMNPGGVQFPEWKGWEDYHRRKTRHPKEEDIIARDVVADLED